mmetsp:Transcript_22544/g.53214  ORF Transcript_22544/g.53214 Transcript_22544/m.53214 type:complete len:200 (-) Transcript_22544:345-944(-)
MTLSFRKQVRLLLLLLSPPIPSVSSLVLTSPGCSSRLARKHFFKHRKGIESPLCSTSTETAKTATTAKATKTTAATETTEATSTRLAEALLPKSTESAVSTTTATATTKSSETGRRWILSLLKGVKSVFPVSIVYFPLFLVTQYGICLTNLDKDVFCFHGILALFHLVWMILEGKFSIGRLDFLFLGFFRQPEDGVVVV